jgi:hypothetical protein
MCHKTFLWIATIIAVLLGIMSVTFNQSLLTVVLVVSRFFEVMIPVLGVAALFKFLCSHGKCCCKGACEKKSCDK